MFGFLTPGFGSWDNVSGGEPRTYFRSESMDEIKTARTSSDARAMIGPIAGLTEKLSKEALEPIVVEAILRHRLFRDVAELRLAEVCDKEFAGKTVGPARLAYIRAMIDCYVQQACLSTLLDVLGYIPDIPTEQK